MMITIFSLDDTTKALAAEYMENGFAFENSQVVFYES
jgi:hypothetical protein